MTAVRATATDETKAMVKIWFAFRVFPLASWLAASTLPPMLQIMVSTPMAFTTGMDTLTALKEAVPSIWPAKSPSTRVAMRGAMAVIRVLTRVIE